MKSVLHIITQCTDRKKVAAPKGLRLRRFRERILARRADAWIGALQDAPTVTDARSLYAGEHWVSSLALEALGLKSGFDTRLWVLSAGLGLVAADTRVPAYSATFSSRVEDSVVQGDEDNASQRQEWLRRLGDRSGGMTVEKLTRTNRGSHFLFVLSRPYIQAVLTDLIAGHAMLVDPDNLLIVTGECPEASSGPLAESWVPSSSRFHHLVGGSRIGQHARVANVLLAEFGAGGLSARAWRQRAQEWLKEAPEPRTYDRQVMSDLEVRVFAKLASHSSWSRALRELRAGGRACEQKRFRKIFKEERAS